MNGWLLYRRDCDSFSVSNSKQKDLLSFKISVAEALIKKGKDIISKKRGRPSLDLMSDGSAATCRPQDDIWGDKIGHWPEVGATRKRCKYLSCSGKTIILCSKYNVHLCLNKNKNCFKLYHQQLYFTRDSSVFSNALKICSECCSSFW